MHRAGPDGALGRIGCGRLAFYSIAIGIGLELREAACAAKIIMFAAVRRNVRRGGRVDRHAADWIGRAPAAFFRALMIVHRRRSRRSEEHTSELQSLMRISYAVICL